MIRFPERFHASVTPGAAELAGRGAFDVGVLEEAIAVASVPATAEPPEQEAPA